MTPPKRSPPNPNEADTFRAIVSTAPYGVIYYDAPSGLVFANRSLTELFGLRALEPMTWRSMEDLTSALEGNEVDTSRLRLDLDRAQGREPGDVAEVYDLGGTRDTCLWISYTSRAIEDPDGRIIGRFAIHSDISKQAQLMSQRDLLGASFSSSEYGLLLYDARNSRVLFNEAFRKLYAVEDIVAMRWVPIEEFSLRVISDTIDTTQILEDLERLRTGDPSRHSECFLLQGSMEGGAWVAYDSIPVHDQEGSLIGRLARHGDVSQQLLMEKELQDLARLPEVNPFPVLRVNHEGIVQYFNQAARDLFAGADLGTLRAGEPLVEEVREAFATGFKSRGRRTDQEVEIRERHLRMSVSPFPDGDQAFIHLEDVTETVKAEEAIREANRKLEQSNRELHENRAKLVQSEKMAALGNLVAGIAHEINNPVGSINSNNDIMYRVSRKIQGVLAELKETDSLPGEQELRRSLDVLDEINRVNKIACDRIVDIVKSLKSFARLDEAEHKEADVHEGLESTLTLLHHEMKNRVEVKREYGSIPLIECYPSQLNQVFMNILANASQAIDQEGTITIRTRHAGGDYIEIEIEDTGRGIESENLERVFEPGFTTKGVGIGSGLGLSISYTIIQEHGGEILVESEPGQGTRFTIRLPVLAPPV